MVNVQLLDKAIEKSGLRVGYILEKLGYSKTTWCKRKNGVQNFKAAEIYVLNDLLHLSEEESRRIFFASEVNPKVN